MENAKAIVKLLDNSNPAVIANYTPVVPSRLSPLSGYFVISIPPVGVNQDNFKKVILGLTIGEPKANKLIQGALNGLPILDFRGDYSNLNDAVRRVQEDPAFKNLALKQQIVPHQTVDFSNTGKILNGQAPGGAESLFITTAYTEPKLAPAWAATASTQGAAIPLKDSPRTLYDLTTLIHHESNGGATKFRMITIAGHAGGGDPANPVAPGVVLSRQGPNRVRFDLESVQADELLILTIKKALTPGGILRLPACGYQDAYNEKYQTDANNNPWLDELQKLANRLGVIVAVSPVRLTSEDQASTPEKTNYTGWFSPDGGVKQHIWTYVVPAERE
jgi:hypothetical protein